MGCMEKTTTVNSLIVTGVFGIAMCVTGFTAMAEVAAESADQGNILTEIVVSAARKRNEDVQTTPVAITALNEAIHDTFEYKKGVTENSTELQEIWKNKKGVCRTAKRPAVALPG